MLKPESLFAEAAPEPTEEVFTTLLEKQGLKIERIASHGHVSPAGFWYDQEQEEWVLLVRGEAVLQVEGQPDLRLKAGDHLRIPAHLRHRVASVSDDALWLAVHF
jgi:cupin 2 domain-containing protein